MLAKGGALAALMNVKAGIRSEVSQDALASELASALDGLFTVEYFRRHHVHNLAYLVIYCKPTRTVADSLLIDREILALMVRVDEIQVRTLHVAQELIDSSAGRLDPSVVVIVHSDKRGDEKLRTWGREQGLRVLPILRPHAGAIPTADALRRKLAQDLFSQDPFSLTGPVLADGEFFGRRNDALELLRQLQCGRTRALFGIRKIGKTSLINRVVSLARETGSPRVAMVDCSLDAFNKLGAEEALRAVAKAAKLAAHQGYCHISDALRKTDRELVPVFSDLWDAGTTRPLAIVFDEVDYITPASPLREHWRRDFNTFWRELRVVSQEAQRMSSPLSVLVSGVSSDAFRVESIDGIENSVLHFIPEEYLAPFARDASTAMLRDLCRRCGLSLQGGDLDAVAEACGDFPYWIRMAGAYIHRSIEVQGRPRELSSEIVSRLLDEFVEAEGTDVATVALEDLRRKTAEPVELLRRTVNGESLSLREGKLLVRYGLVSHRHGSIVVSSAMIVAAAKTLVDVPEKSPAATVIQPPTALLFAPEEWAEELSMINRRRILVERKLREFIHFALKLSADKGENWADKVVAALPASRRSSLAALSGEGLLSKLYWKELAAIINKNWPAFERTIGDKRRFTSAMDLLNDRPDAHAKASDAADVALHRRELAWLEEMLS